MRKDHMEDPSAIQRLLQLGLTDSRTSSEAWFEACRDALRSRLAGPVDFSPTTDGLPSELDSFSGVVELTLPASTPLARLLASPDTPPPVLRVIARRAKKACRDATTELDESVENALYFAAVAAAEVHHGCRISRLSDDQLVQAVQYYASVPWLVPPIGELIEKARQLRA